MNVLHECNLYVNTYSTYSTAGCSCDIQLQKRRQEYKNRTTHIDTAYGFIFQWSTVLSIQCSSSSNWREISQESSVISVILLLHFPIPLLLCLYIYEADLFKPRTDATDDFCWNIFNPPPHVQLPQQQTTQPINWPQTALTSQFCLWNKNKRCVCSCNKP